MEIDFNNLPLAKKREKRFYGSASFIQQAVIDGLSPEMVKERDEDIRDNEYLVNHDLDMALPSYEQDDDYSEDRYPQEGDVKVQLYF